MAKLTQTYIVFSHNYTQFEQELNKKWKEIAFDRKGTVKGFQYELLNFNYLGFLTFEIEADEPKSRKGR